MWSGKWSPCLNFLLASGSPAEPLDAALLTLRFCGTLVEKHWYRAYIQYIQIASVLAMCLQLHTGLFYGHWML